MPPVKRVFVTASSFTGDLEGEGSGSNGLDGADRLCVAAAEDAGLGGTWVAYLSVNANGSVPSVNAIDRVIDVAPWYLVDGTTLVFSAHSQLADTATNPLNMTEAGEVLASGKAWTGSTRAGVSAGQRCSEWTSDASGNLGAYGDVTNAFDWAQVNTDRCNTEAHLYCFEQ